MTRRRLTRLAIAVVAVLALVSGGSYLWVVHRTDQLPDQPPPVPVAMLMRPVPDGPRADLIRRGQALTIAGDCVSCHSRAGGPPFGGGLGLKTPFGVIYSPNITGDAETGMGRWTTDEFYRAMTRGIGRGGEHLYPAFPYTYLASVRRADADAILAYLKTLPPVRYTPPANLLPFPANLRPSVIAWNAAFFRPQPFSADPGRSAAWNRGAYLVNGLGHCAACHTAKTLAASDKAGAFLQGGELNGWVAPDLTGNGRTGLGRWSVADVAEYLKTGRNAHANAAGPMAEVVSYSTGLMPDADLRAMGIYLKSLPASGDAAPDRPDAAVLRRGAAVYADACAACHLGDGRGQPRYFPPLPGHAGAQQANADTLIHVILAGARTGPTPARPSALTMPSFAWKLDDQEIAAVATYVRNGWGNRAAPVEPTQVATLRRSLRLPDPPTPGGDR